MSGRAKSLKTIFDEAAEIVLPEERAVFLDEACGGDASLRGHVDALLVAFDQAGSFMEVSPARDMLSGTAGGAGAVPVDDTTRPGTDPEKTVGVEPSTAIGTRGSQTQVEKRGEGGVGAVLGSPDALSTLLEGPGTVIGVYKLLQKIGEGGMGAVFMAEQEKPVRRKVALKVIKPGMDTRQVVARFEAERQALAMMEHPHIARVLDAGATSSGRPYFVMELVKGVPITEYCDRNRLTPRERLELFIPVCQAIQHAHQKGIIHRDIKPSNVLVTLHDGVPMPKVIDFGVAKAIEQRLTERTMFTEFGQVIGTLEYMSPEQAEMGALDIDTRSDIYSLGVMLYELLAGSTPLERAKLRQAGYAEILKRIREEEPVRPSTRLSESKETLPTISAQRKMEPARLRKLVRGDLDWIVMKSLEKDRTRRYETATGIAKDIRRYLDGDAVEASPPSATYKLRKFGRKHRGALAGVSAFGLLLIVASVISIGLALWANRERARAEDREQVAIEAVKRFGDAVGQEPALKNKPELEELRKRLLKEPLTFFRVLRDRLQSGRDTRPASLDRLAQASFEVGSLTNEIGDKEDALVAYRESLAFLESLPRFDHTVGTIQRHLALVHNAVGDLLNKTGKRDEALAAHERAREILKANLSIADREKLLGETEHQIGTLWRDAGRLTDARNALETALEIRRKLAQVDPRNEALQGNLVETYKEIGLVLKQIGKSPEALDAYEKGREIGHRLVKLKPGAAESQVRLASVYLDLGGPLLESIGKPDKAHEVYRSALAILQTAADENPSVTLYQISLSSANQSMGGLLDRTGQTAAALAAYEKARTIVLRLASAHPTVVNFQDDLSRNHQVVGELLYKTGKPAEAMKAFESALEIQQKLVDENPTIPKFRHVLARSLHSVGTVLVETDQLAEGMKAFDRGLDLRQKLVAENPGISEYQSRLGLCHQAIGTTLVTAGKRAEAMKAYEAALTTFQKLAKANPGITDFEIDLAYTQYLIGNLLGQSGRPYEAIKAYESAVVIEQKLADANRQVTRFQEMLGFTRHSIGNRLRELGKTAEAMKEYERALPIQQRLVDWNPTIPQFRKSLALNHHTVGLCLSKIGKPNEAIKSFERALSIRQKLVDSNPTITGYQDDLASSYVEIGLLLGDLGKLPEAVRAHESALAIRRKLAREHPERPDFVSDLGGTLSNIALNDNAAGRFAQARDRLKEAMEWQEKALASDPANRRYRQFMFNHLANLVTAFRGLGDAAGEKEVVKKQAELRASDPAVRALDARLMRIVAGDEKPKDWRDRLILAQVAHDKSLHVAAVRLLREALDIDPTLADNRETQAAYNAACSAALAGCGQAKDAPPDYATEVKLRRQALEWLRAELAIWKEILAKDAPGANERVAKTMADWRADPDLAGIRDASGLKKLPEDERNTFETLWTEVDQVLGTARARK